MVWTMENPQVKGIYNEGDGSLIGAEEAADVWGRKEAETVKSLLIELRKIKVKRDVACGSLILQLQELQEELSQATKPFDDASEQIEFEIKNLMHAIQKTIKTDCGQVSYRRGYHKVTYDSKALDAIDLPIVRACIEDYRKETEVKPSVEIEVY